MLQGQPLTCVPRSRYAAAWSCKPTETLDILSGVSKWVNVNLDAVIQKMNSFGTRHVYEWFGTARSNFLTKPWEFPGAPPIPLAVSWGDQQISEGTVGQSSAASTPGRPVRRSTRLDEIVPVTVRGVDVERGPYCEGVSTSSISCHGCKYESKYEVVDNSVVILELNGAKPGAAATTARGRVKWSKRPPYPGALFQTAIEFDVPGNVWGINKAPGDWFPFDAKKAAEFEAAKSKPFAVPRPDASASAATAEQTNRGTAQRELQHESQHATQHANQRDSHTAMSFPTSSRPISQLMADFQQQMERTLSEAAAVAIQEKAAPTLAEARNMLQDEARRAIAAAAAIESEMWIKQSVEQMKHLSVESARALHAQWMKRIEADVQKASERIEARRRELDQLVETTSMSAIERLHSATESTLRDGMDRIVARLKEQLVPFLDQAQKTATELNKGKDEAKKIVEQSLQLSTAHMAESRKRFEIEFETIVQQRIDAARQELEHAGIAAVNSALENLGEASQKHEAEARVKLKQALTPVSDSALDELRARAAETSQQFAEKLVEDSRKRLETVGNAISELARGLGKAS